ncbi:hypothetical protein BFG04_04730 [Campylobacter pinnipediorum subsp. pinnipediorum]|uniref:EamA domain-containing protein n=1 Tax=Campylobacter pinnipediorum subsp. pinnipediorum TaxID=1660067 RepID=A0AAX0L8Z8_9BACT|nr:DMT family transporter [Campylobacter pinnipediorum]OPA76395.1 hypothetical protein BFG04_04730 [Campylobacter pinnipediorum subsp. pinnipediorum]OPA79856.1 hypothetical protein BFG05_01785 [Campylobacter pinnipediorum subsp. pinnipediorum]
MSFKFQITEFRADIALLFTAVVWGASLLPMSNAADSNDVFTILFWRFFISFFIMGAVALKFDKKFDKNSIKYGLILGLFLFLGFTSQTFALTHTYSSSVSFISGLNVAIVPFVVFLIFRRKIYIQAYVGIVLGTIGLYFLTDSKVGFGLGEALSLVCALSWALHIVFTSEFVKKCEIFTLITTQFAVIFILSAIFGVGTHGSIVPILDDDFYKVMFITIAFSTIFGFIMQSVMLAHTSPIKAALLFTFEPVTAGFLGYFIGNEHLTGLQIFGGIIIIAGILISEIGSYLNNKRIN